MNKMKNDDFDVVAKKKLKLTPVLFDKKENGFDGLFQDKNNNLVIIIKKHDNSVEGFGLDLLLDKEGSMDWVNKIITEMSSPDNNLYSELNAEVAKKIYQNLLDQKLRRILIYCKIDTPIFIMSECDQNEVWKYIDAVKYYLNHFWKRYY